MPDLDGKTALVTGGAIADQIAFGRLGEPEDIGDFVCALASPAGR